MRYTLPRLAASVALFVFTVFPGAGQPAASRSGEDDVWKTDESYRVAKLHRDIQALDGILADQFNETNQNGNSRNKAETLDLWRTFPISSLTTDSHQVRIAGNTATVTGTQTENGTERMIFTRTYGKRPNSWQLLASMQFRDPNPASAAAASSPGEEGDVMRADEAYRLAKVHRDTQGLQRILADEFFETNQNGHSRDKAQILELWGNFSISSLTTDTIQVRVAGDTAMVMGTQTENGTDRMLFTRVYVKRASGWQLLASMQFLDPNRDRGL